MLELLLNGAVSGQGFLVAPAGGQVFSGTLSLRVAAGADIDVLLRTAATSATAVFFDQPAVHVTTVPTSVKIHSIAGSVAVNDTVIEAVAGGNVLAQFQFTVVQNPVLRYSGRFQCRLATDPDPFNSPWGLNSSFGMYAVEGPDPTNPDEPPLDRIIRFQDPVALRPFCEPVGVTATAIEAQVGTGTTSLFKVGDSVLGLPVRLGPNSKFESQDGAFAQAGFEPISEFELRVGMAFFGRSAPAVPRNASDPPGSTAPYADGLFKLDEVGPWKPGDFGYPEPNWTKHSVAVTTAKKAALLAQAPSTPAATRIRDRRLQEHNTNLGGIQAAMRLIERYSGLIDRDLNITPGDSVMLAYLASFAKFSFLGEFFNFDTDVQSGLITGTLAAG
jgi:hypothetical protein